MKNYTLLFSSTLALSGCFAGAQNFPTVSLPQHWDSEVSKNSVPVVETQMLKNWWQKFDDPALNMLVDLSLKDSPDRLIAESRIVEARGLHRTARSSLFPQIGASSKGGRQDNGVAKVDDYYDASFDASYEIDIFGKNRKNVSAANAQIQDLEAQYHDMTLSLIAETARSYISYRGFQKQSAIAQKNLQLQEKTLELIRQQFKFGEAQSLDIERAKTLVNTTRASLPGFQRFADNARLQLSVLTGTLPEELSAQLADPADIPSGKSALPALMAPAQVLSVRPDIRAASANLAAKTSLAESVTAELFPTLTLSGLYGVSESVLINSTTVWSTALGAAVSLLDFGRIEGRIDASRAREAQAYQLYRKTVLAAVTEVETALTDTAHLNEQRISLQKAYNSAQRAFTLSESLYKEGEISFLDLLDAQRTVNEADSALVTSEAAQAESLVRLYKSLGVY